MAIFYTSGVKYIKIARYDANGNDNYQSLRQLDNIRLKTNDNGIINYPVATITEYPSSSLNGPYFLYQVGTTNATSSTNNQILNYRVDVQRTISFTFDPSTGAEETLVEFYDIENFNSLGYMNSPSGSYTLGNTPNIPIIVTASATWNNNFFGAPLATNPIISLRRINGPTSSNQIILQKSSSAASLSGTVVLTGSFTPIEGEVYGIFVSDTSLINPTRFDGNTLVLTQSQSPVAGIGAQTILEPYITTPFINSDYDVLMNNAVANRPNSFYMDVDFADSQVLPINQQAILSSSASPAVIQDSNYSSAGWVNSRYIGKELTSQKLNVWSVGDVTGGEKVPNVSNPKSYFVQFNWLAGTSPEWGNNNAGKTNVSIKYIIDENGNEVPPIFDENGINLGNIQQAFNDNATLVLSNPDSFGVNLDALNSTVPVFRAGQRIRPIAYTQTASYDNNGNVIGFGYTGSINFVQGDVPNELGGSNNDYRLLTFANNGLNIINENTLNQTAPYTAVIKWNPPIQLGASASFATSSAGAHPSTGSIYKPTGSLAQLSGSGYILDVKAVMYFDYNLTSYRGANNLVKAFISLQKNTGTGYSNISTTSFDFIANIGAQYPNPIALQYTDRAATTSSLYRVLIETGWNKDSGIDGAINIRDISYFQVTQYPAPNTGPVTQFWLTGSNSNLLYAKKGSSANIFGLNDVWGQKQQNINNSGFDPIVYDFEPQAGDEIRFQGVEQQAYTISQITQSVTQSAGTGNYNALTLVLDRPVSNNINTDYFLLRRYVNDPGNIILDISKPAGQTSDGILIPEFLGEKATETKEKIISLLRANQ
jgi:hypothetical protein